MSKRYQKRVVEDDEDDRSDASNDREAEDERELGITIDDLEKKIKEWFMTDKLIQWLRANPKVVDFIRKVVIGVFEEWGIMKKYSASTHPVWSNVTAAQRRRGFRNNPDLRHTGPQIKWLQSLKIAGAPEGGYAYSLFKSAATFVSGYWRRHRHALKQLIMSAVFDDDWGTEEDPINNGTQMSDFFETDEGQKQLEKWIVTEYMKVAEELADDTTPAPGLYVYVKEEILRLRNKYENEEDMNEREAMARKEEEGEDIDEELRQDYERGDDCSDEEQKNKNKNKKKVQKKPSPKKIAKEKKKIRRSEDSEGNEVEKEKDKNMKTKKNAENNTDERSPTKKSKKRIEPNPSPKKSQPKKKDTEKATKVTNSSKYLSYVPSSKKKSDDNGSEADSQRSSGKSKSNNSKTKDNGNKRSTRAKDDNDDTDSVPPLPKPKISKPKATPPAPKKNEADEESYDEDVQQILAQLAEEEREKAQPTKQPTRKKNEKEEKGKEPETEVQEVRSSRVTRANPEGSNTNVNPKKRTVVDADLARSESPARKKQKKNKDDDDD